MTLTSTLGFGLAALITFSLASGTSQEPTAQQEQATTASDSGGPVSKLVTGKIAGKVSFVGDIVKTQSLVVPAQQAKGCCAEGVAVDDQDLSLMIDESGGVANAVISIKIEGRKPKIPTKPAVIDQKGCRFLPHLTVLPAGGTVEFKNSDKAVHNIHTYPFKNGQINRAVLGDTSLTQKYKYAEAIKIGCDMHTWMSCYVYVTDASVWAVTAKDGSFTLPELPAGEYKLKIWHEKLGKSEATATIAADGSCHAVEVLMTPKKTKRRRRR
ncbi:MAG: plastocyanin [Planctomycetota bacterium]|jgi:plastocyanin